MIPLFVDANPDFEIGTAVGNELERQKVATYVHDHPAPELLAAIFSIGMSSLGKRTPSVCQATRRD
jgi:hypothetical protein